eukprot:3333341-Prymnesium_polylepis.1
MRLIRPRCARLVEKPIGVDLGAGRTVRPESEAQEEKGVTPLLPRAQRVEREEEFDDRVARLRRLAQRLASLERHHGQGCASTHAEHTRPVGVAGGDHFLSVVLQVQGHHYGGDVPVFLFDVGDFDVDAVETGAARDTDSRAHHLLLDQGLLLVQFVERVDAESREH